MNSIFNKMPPEPCGACPACMGFPGYGQCSYWEYIKLSSQTSYYSFSPVHSSIELSDDEQSERQ